MKNIGLVTDIAFWEVGNGQNARIYELYTFLHKHCLLTLYYLGTEISPFPTPLIQYENKKTQLTACLQAAQHDLIIVEKLHLEWVADLQLDAPIYLDAHDLISERAKSFQKFNRECAAISFDEEIAKFRKFDKVILMQKDEIEKVVPKLGKDKLLLCPHSVSSENDVIIREEVETISFFGGPSWPNVDGIQWFHDLVLPLLGDLAQKCIVQGAIVYSPFFSFSPQISKGKFFDSSPSYYKNIDIAINPILYGSGLKIKTVEAIAWGIPLVTTSVGAQGLNEEKGRSFLVADTPEEFAFAIYSLSASSALRRKISSQAKEYSKIHFSPSACFSALLI